MLSLLRSIGDILALQWNNSEPYLAITFARYDIIKVQIEFPGKCHMTLNMSSQELYILLIVIVFIFVRGNVPRQKVMRHIFIIPLQ